MLKPHTDEVYCFLSHLIKHDIFKTLDHKICFSCESCAVCPVACGPNAPDKLRWAVINRILGIKL